MPTLIVGHKIGAGSHGSVYRGSWDEREVAIKMFDVTKSEVLQEDDTIQTEIRVLERLRHQHIIGFIEATYYNNKLVLIMEYAQGQSLKSAIKEHKLPVTCWCIKTRIAQEIARGLAYIHGEDILHRDLKSGNVLLTSHLEVKLCDFGMAKAKVASGAKASGGNPKGTIRWMAPELFEETPAYSTKSDVYSLGMVMWEMAADCTVPFRDHLATVLVRALVKSGEREELPVETPIVYQLWVERCWRQDPKKRPEANDMATMVEHPLSKALARKCDCQSIPLHPCFAQHSGFVAAVEDVVEAEKEKEEEIPEKEVNEGEEEEKEEESMSATETCFMRAEGNDPDAQVELARMYSQGEGVDKSDSKAFEWCYRAARLNHEKAQHWVGDLFFHGRGVAQDYKKAAFWFRKAALQGHVVAQHDLGCMYEDGLGVEQDDNEAIAWLRESARQGYAAAQHGLGTMYEDGRGVEKDLTQAVEWYLKAAEQGDDDAQSRLGWMYLKGIGVDEQNYTTAFCWLRRAAYQSNPSAAFNIGCIHAHGLGVPRNSSEARIWFLHAAELGHPRAQYRLAKMYEIGTYFAKDLQEAVTWYGKAAKNGNADAKKRLIELERLEHGK